MTDMSVDEFNSVIDVDLIAPFIMAKAVLPGMVKKKKRQNNKYLLHDE